MIRIRDNWRRWLGNLPAGLWVALAVGLLVGGRYAWILASRPADADEIAAAYGSVRLFYGSPQADSTGSHLIFVATADLGYGLFLADANTGHKTMVCNQTNYDDYTWNLHAWPWSPDDKTFAYSQAGKITIADPSGATLTNVNTATNLSELAWLSPSAFVCLEENDKLYYVAKQADSTWSQLELSQQGSSSPQNAGLSSQNGVGLGAANIPAQALNLQRVFEGSQAAGQASNSTASVCMEYQCTGPLRAVTQYQLVSPADDENTAPSDWELSGSSDGIQWAVLDVRSNETFVSQSQVKQYAFANQVPYQFFRLNLTAIAGGRHGAARLADFQLWAEATPDVASANPPGGANEGAVNVFDGSSGTKWYSGNPPGSGWLQYRFGGGTAWALSRYALTSANDVPERDPKNWQFQASNDGQSWTNLDTRTNETFASRFQTKSYSFANSTPYRFYRLNITTNAGGAAYGLQLSELDLGTKDLLAGKALRSNGANGMASAANGVDATSVFGQDMAAEWSSGSMSVPVWLQYQFTGPLRAIDQYALVSSLQDAKSDPRDWKLLASNDGKTWDVLDVRTNETFALRGQTKKYALASQPPFRFYRLNITATAGRTPGPVRLSKFQLWTDDLPDMASANPPGGVNEEAAKAFDGTARTKWYAGGLSSGWLQYQFGGGAAWAISGYDLTSANDMPGRDPMNWLFQASNDGANWMALDTRVGETFSARFQTKSYSFSNATPYRFYRLFISTNAGGGTAGLQLAELNLKATNDMGELASISVPENPFLRPFALVALSSNAAAWAQSNHVWSLNVTSTVPISRVDAPPNAAICSLSYAQATGQFLLSCIQDGKGSLWSCDLADSSSLHEITDPGPIRDGRWLSGTNRDWVDLAGSHLRISTNQAAKFLDLMSVANIGAFSVSAASGRLFFRGSVSNELSAGIWRYDVGARQVHCVVPSTDLVSPYVSRVRPEQIHNAILTDNGHYTVYMPVDYKLHPHRKYPLILGDTDFGVVNNGAHGRLWVPAMAACGAYVVIANRGGWWNNLDKWGETVTTAYQRMSSLVSIDKSRIFVFGASAETTYISEFLTNSAVPCRGVILLNPTGLPDFSNLSPLQSRPKIFISAGELEQMDEKFKQYQKDALRYSGSLVDVVIAPGEGHHFIGNAAQIERTKAMVRFIFEE